MEFNIFNQLFTELDEFAQKKVHIAGDVGNDEAKYLKGNEKGYEFSQNDTVNLIELYYNSKYETGKIDSEGQRKVFLNICRFRADVAAKQTDIDVKDFVFVPDDNNSYYGAFFLTKKFKRWAREQYFGSVINELNTDFSKFGTCVAKRVRNSIERVPIKNLINQQDAKSLEEARYVIEKHEDMTFDEMEAMKGWDVADVDMEFGDKANVFERYGYVPLSWYKEQKDMKIEDGDEKRSIKCLAILVPDLANKKKQTGSILFIEEVTKLPYEEAHWAKVDGRWLGVGEIENQFENQIARNMTVNMRKRALYWSSKKLFQSKDTDVAKNLVRNVKDGDVLKIGVNGEISPIAIETRNISEFQNFEDVWEKNSDQKSFTYEVATGESLPSGTPFRLGVVMTNAVNSHFNLKRENFGIFLGKIVTEQLLTVFKKDNRKEHELLFAMDEKGVEQLKRDTIEFNVFENVKQQILAGKLPVLAEIQERVQAEIERRKMLSVTVPEGYYDYVKATVDIVTTGENVNIEKKLESLTNLYNSLEQQGDPRAAQVLAKIMVLVGEDMQDFGQAQTAQPMQMPQAVGQLPQQQPVNTAV